MPVEFTMAHVDSTSYRSWPRSARFGRAIEESQEDTKG